jgi:hypothetical protein
MLKVIIFSIQKLLLYISFYIFKTSNVRYNTVIGVTEIASNIKYISEVLPKSATVCLESNKYYNYNYNYQIVKTVFVKFRYLIKIIYGPVLLGYLSTRTNNFFYIWSDGFLISEIDGREFEFSFLNKLKKNIFCFFCGNDIRSPQLEIKLGQQLKFDVAANYYKYIQKRMLTDEYENTKKKLAMSADKYAKYSFNADIDQKSYLEKKSLPFLYFFPEHKFNFNVEKFYNIEKLKIIHAPSSPLLKGTQLVRAAIKKLEIEGYSFDYIELENTSNEIILDHLRSSHIALNEFFMFMPGLFGVEAMAKCCVLMTSADETIENSLPSGSNDAWVVTRYYEIYDRLKLLLDHKESLKEIAQKGYEWAINNTNKRSELILKEYCNELFSFDD